jgi:hypothetical protein
VESHELVDVMTDRKFNMGKLVATPGAIDDMAAAGIRPDTLVDRHMQGDWGAVCKEDAVQNELALTHGMRLMSVYNLGPDAGCKTVWIITEWDRSVTTILRPGDY